MTDARRLALLAAFCAAAAAAIYVRVLHGGFVYDDVPAVVENVTLQGRSLAAVLLYTRFRPLVNLSYAADAALFGLAPFGFHLAGVLFHAANAALAALLSDAAFRDAAAKTGAPAPPMPLRVLPALVFALHPANTQAVAYIAARGEVLSATFGFLTLLLLRRALTSGGARWLLASALTLLLALLGKESAAVIPAIALAWALLLLPASDRRTRRALWISLAVLAVAGLARVLAFRQIEAVPPRGMLENLALQPLVLLRYAGLLAFPAGQSLLHPPPADSRFFLASAVLAAIAVALYRLRRRAPLVAFGALWFVLMLAPSSLVPLLEPFSEQRVYAASLGFFLAAGDAALQLLGPRAAAVALAAAAIACVPLTLRRNALWAEPRLLWAEAAARVPDSWRAQYALGKDLADRGDCAGAEPSLRRAAALSKGDVRPHNELARCLSAQGRNAEAFAVLDAALKLSPRSDLTFANLAALAVAARRPDLARRFLAEAIALDPHNDARRRRLESLQALSPAPDAPWPPSP